MAALSILQSKVETEGDLQVLNILAGQLADNDTFSINSWFNNVENIQMCPVSAATTIGAIVASGVITFHVGATGNVYVRIAGN